MTKTNLTHELAEIQKGLRALELHEKHPLEVYRPTEFQLPIHESPASEVLTTGGKRCLPGWQTVYDPVAKRERMICQIESSFHVLARSPRDGSEVIALAGKPFTKGCDEFYEITLSTGRKFDATPNHLVLTTWGWISVGAAYALQRECGQAHLVSNSAPCPSGFPLDDGRSSRRLPGSGDHYWPDYRPCGEQPQTATAACLAPAPSPDGALAHSRENYTEDVLEHTPTHSQTYLAPGRPSIPCVRDQTFDREDALEYRASYTTYSPASSCVRGSIQSPPQSFAHPRTDDELTRDPNRIPSGHASSPCASPESEVSIVAMRYLGKATVWDFEVAATGNYQLAGVLHHNSGKTVAVVMEFASRILGIPITRQDGTKIPLRFRAPTKRNPGLYWVIGFDINHIGQTLYHRLFSPGLGDGAGFRIIQDIKTQKWRSYNPNLDRERYGESELSPPMFGPHLILPKSWHMESAAGNVFRSVRLTNGATICAYPSTGDSPKKGDAVDGIWIDEDIEKGSFLKEWQDRLATTCGWFLWSVWPQVANEALLKTLDRAEREKDNPEKPIEVFRLGSADNPYSDRKGIAQMLARMEDDDDEAHRAQGDISSFISGRLMYNFGRALHELHPEACEKPDGPKQVLCDLLSLDPRRLPKDWTRYLVVDPSHTRTACLIGVVPPPEFKDLGNRLIIEEEIIVKKYTPAQFAEEVKNRVGGFRFEAFVMDQMAGRQTTIGADATVFQTYEREFRQRGLISRVTGSGFMRGCNDKSLRRRCVRDLMEPTENGWPRFLFSCYCPQTIKELRNFRKKEVKDQEGRPVPTDDGAAERLYDAVACVEYLGEYVHGRFRDGTAYVPPDQGRSLGSMAYHAAQAILTAMNKAGGYAHYGPGAAA